MQQPRHPFRRPPYRPTRPPVQLDPALVAFYGLGIARVAADVVLAQKREAALSKPVAAAPAA